MHTRWIRDVQDLRNLNINNIIRCMKVVIIDDDKSSGKAFGRFIETKYGMEVLGCALWA